MIFGDRTWQEDAGILSSFFLVEYTYDDTKILFLLSRLAANGEREVAS